MRKYIATNYGMGIARATHTFTAWSDEDAVRIAEKLLPGYHGLPGSAKGAGRASRVIGIKRVN